VRPCAEPTAELGLPLLGDKPLCQYPSFWTAPVTESCLGLIRARGKDLALTLIQVCLWLSFSSIVVFTAVRSDVPRRGRQKLLIFWCFRRNQGTMRRRITNLDPEARDARPINFDSADAHELINEYSGLAVKGRLYRFRRAQAGAV
jgi:hypothetical protein